jgi:hypothetical protein
MNWRRIAVGTVVLGIVGNAIDWVLNTYVMTGVYATMADIMNPSPNMMWYVVGDVVAAFMLMLAWDMVGSKFGTGLAAGAKFGAAAGLFITFPMFLFWQINLRGMPYSTAWIMIGVVTLWYAVLGAIAAMLDRKTATG